MVNKKGTIQCPSEMAWLFVSFNIVTLLDTYIYFTSPRGFSVKYIKTKHKKVLRL